jgi:hypothetical protein
MDSLPDEPPNLFHVIPYEYASEIAYIISGWAQLEYEMDALIWELAGLSDTPSIGVCLTAQFSTVNVRLNALISLAKVRNVPEFKISKLNRFRERSGALADRRNRVAHDPWLGSYDDEMRNLQNMYRLQRTARGKLDHEYKMVPIEELQGLKKEIEEAHRHFRDLAYEILQTFWNLPPLPWP